MRRAILWRLGVGAAMATLVLVVVLVRGAEVNLPLVLVLVLATFMPAARYYGSARARAFGQEVRARRRGGS